MATKIKEQKISDILRDETASSAHAIRRVVIIGCVVNAILMILKLCAGYFGHSDALVADGFHSLNDLAADIIMLVFVGISFRRPDSRFPYGYGKFETFSTFLIASFLIIVGSVIGIEAIEKIIDFFGGGTLEQPDIWTVVVVIVAMACKEGLFRFYSAAGRRHNTPALLANAWHHRSDALASIATLIGVSAAHFFGTPFRILDPVASLVIAVFIIVAAVRLFHPAFLELMDCSLPSDRIEIARNAIEELPGVIAEDIRARRNGHHLIFDITVNVNSDISVAKARSITEEIKTSLRKSFCQHITVNVGF